MSLTRIWIPSPNYSASRVRTQLLVIHTAEGATTFRELGSYFANRAVEASSHVGIDDTPDQIGEYITRERKAWAAFAANDWGEHAELCGFARWTRDEWLQHPVMLHNTALWLKEESARYNIRLQHVGAAEIRAGMNGVCGHADLVTAGAGGSHWDPGTSFPWDVVLMDAPATPSTPTPPAPVQTPVNYPTFRGRMLTLSRPMMAGEDIRVWQQQMKDRGWNIVADGWYGPASETICRQFQAEKNLGVDGIVGPITWNAAWTATVT